MNYFELFEIPVSPKVDRSLLATKYFSLQKKYHPDFYTSATDEEKEEVLKISADINKAFNTFKDPDLTIEYFLRLNNHLATDEKYELPKDFLMEMMELNEAISEEGQEEVEQKIKDFETELNDSIRPVLDKN